MTITQGRLYRAILAVLLFAFGLAVWLVSQEGFDVGFFIGFSILGSFAVFSIWLTHKRPDNNVSWLLLTVTTTTMVSQTAWDYFASGLPGAEVAFILHVALLWANVGQLALILLIFPTGSPPTHRWNWILWSTAVAVATQWIRPVYLSINRELEDLVDGPSGVETIDLVVTAGQALAVVSIGGALVSLIVRSVRSTGVERKQILYVLPALVLLAGFWILESTIPESPVSILFLALGALLFPVSIGLSILRYRLYDIDRIASRTVSYALLVAFLGFVFFGLVTVVSNLLPAESPLVVAASTLAVAALFNPVRMRVQGWVDRRFNRSRYDAERVMNEFAGSLQGRVDPEGVGDGWVGVVSETMQPKAVGLWVKE